MAQDSSTSVDTQRAAEFTRLYQSCEAWLYSYLLAILRRHEDAEDVLQETARVCWEKFGQYYHPGTEFRAWACRIAYFKALKYRQQRNKAPVTLSDQFFDKVDEEAIVMADVLDAKLTFLEKCVKKLPAEDRKLLRLRYTLAKTTQAIATLTGKSVHAIYRAFVRIHNELFHCIDLAMRDEENLQ